MLPETVPADAIDLGGATVIPGLVEVHSHGNSGADFSDGDYEGLKAMAKYYAQCGATSFAPASMTLPYDVLSKAFANAKQLREEAPEGYSRIMGIQMEGPYFSYKKRGAQNADYLMEPDFDGFKKLYDEADGLLTIVDIAPELPGAVEFVEKASKLCTVSIACSASNMWACLCNVLSWGISEEEALRAASFNPANANDKVVGILTRYHLLRPRRKRVVLVDHNETAQSVPGLEEAEIVEIIDHHRVADIQTNKNLFSSNLTTPPPAEDKVSQATVPSNHLFESKLRSVVFTHHRNHQRNRRSIHQNTENLAEMNSQRSAKISAFIYYLMVMNSSQFRRMYYLPFYRLPCTLYFEFFRQRTCMKEEHS